MPTLSESATKSDTQVSKNASVQKGSKPRKLKFTFKEQQEYYSIEDDIAKLEAEIAACEAKATNASSDFLRLQELQAQKEELTTALEVKTERWVYLSELAEKIESQQ
jgi:ATP-binding cassette subfamily F protein uup